MGNFNCCCKLSQADTDSQPLRVQDCNSSEEAMEARCQLRSPYHRLRYISNGFTSVNDFLGHYVQHYKTNPNVRPSIYGAIEWITLCEITAKLYIEMKENPVYNTEHYQSNNQELKNKSDREKIENFTLFQVAVLMNNQDLVKKYLREGANVNQVVSASDSNRFAGYSPMHLALVEFENKNRLAKLMTIYQLLHYGADVNSRNFNGDTPLCIMFCQWSVNKDIYDFLKRHGAEVSSTNMRRNDVFKCLSFCLETFVLQNM